MSERTGGRGRVVALALGCAVLGGVVAGLVVAAASDDGGDEGGGGNGASEQDGTTTAEVPLDEEGDELVALIERSDQLTYTATYSFADTSDAGQSLVLTVFRKGDRNRQDIEGTSGGQPVRSSVFAEPGRSVGCTATPEGAWQCQTMAETPAPLDQLITGVREQLSGRDVVASDATIAGTEVRCFSITEGADTAELCVRPDGVAVRVSSGTATLELTSFGTDVDDAVFVPPAEPSG